MTQTISDKTGAYLGWCPNARTLDAQPPCTSRTGPSGITDPEPPRPGTSPATAGVPSWMTAAAMIILFATCFVGGNIWWPAFVLVVLAIFILIHIRTMKQTGCVR